MLLDLGCGDSRDRFIAAKRGIVAFGVDLFPPLQRSRERFVCADARRLPFASESAEAVICQAMIALIPPDDRVALYAEVARVLKPGGWFSISIYSLTDGWTVKREEESERIRATGLQLANAGVYRKEEAMSEALIVPSKEQQSTVHLVARNPVEMQNAQADLAAWLKNKLTEIEIEVRDLNAALNEARQNGWSLETLTRQRNKAVGQETYYFKLLTAVEAGYTIIPEFPIDVFAIRVTRSGVRARDNTSTYTSGYPSIDDERPDIAAVGLGEYKSPSQMVRHGEYKEMRGDKEVTVRFTQAAEFRDVAFPLRAARPLVMSATAQAMALKVFDQIDICQPTRNAGVIRRGDPLIIGQILGQRSGWSQKCANFIIAWHLNLNEL